MKLVKLLGLLLLLSISYVHASSPLHVTYEPSKKYNDIYQSLKTSESLKELISVLNENLKLPQGLKVIFNEGEETAYDPESKTILISYEFADEIKDLFTQEKSTLEDTPIEATIQTLMYMLSHEIAHALIDQYNLPVVGKEEDAADGLAIVILNEFFESGQDIVLNAATFFDLVSADRQELTDEDFWDEHSLDEQRLYNALCYVYGSDPKQYADVKKLAGFPTERADLCEEEYAKLADSWDMLLKPYLKP